MKDLCLLLFSQQFLIGYFCEKHYNSLTEKPNPFRSTPFWIKRVKTLYLYIRQVINLFGMMHSSIFNPHTRLNYEKYQFQCQGLESLKQKRSCKALFYFAKISPIENRSEDAGIGRGHKCFLSYIFRFLSHCFHLLITCPRPSL